MVYVSKIKLTKPEQLVLRLKAQKIIKMLLEKQGRRRKWLAEELEVVQAHYLSSAAHMSVVPSRPHLFKCPMWVIERLLKWYENYRIS